MALSIPRIRRVLLKLISWRVNLTCCKSARGIGPVNTEQSQNTISENYIRISEELMNYYKFEQGYMYKSCWNDEKKPFNEFIHYMTSSNISQSVIVHLYLVETMILKLMAVDKKHHFQVIAEMWRCRWLGLAVTENPLHWSLEFGLAGSFIDGDC
ncbi:hypothetical protein BT93_C0714 [Corymbia citriodora subsp. variegata]|nr:hypothetical protein BT93_C0714 [Corymbia citriodora subsp. variegata]